MKKKWKSKKNKISTRKEQLEIEKVGNVQTIEIAKKELEKSIEAIGKFEKLESDKKELEDFREAADEFALRTSEFIKAKSEAELRYKGSNIRNDCDLLSKQLKELNDEIQSAEATLNSDKNQLKEFSNQYIKIESSLDIILRSFGYPDILSSFTDILPDAEFSGLKQQLSDLSGNIKSIKALIQRASETKQQLLLSDDGIKSKDKFLEELNSTLQQLESDKQSLSEYRAQKIQNDVRKTRVEKLRREVDETRQTNLKWELLCKYIGDATGKRLQHFCAGAYIKKVSCSH